MRNYELTFIVDPVLSSDEIEATAKSYIDHIKAADSEVVHVDEIGLRQLAYPINKRTSGVYYSVEFKNETGELLPKVELAMRRDERIMRFLTIKLDKYGVEYNANKRDGKIPTMKERKQLNAEKKEAAANESSSSSRDEEE